MQAPAHRTARNNNGGQFVVWIHRTVENNEAAKRKRSLHILKNLGHVYTSAISEHNVDYGYDACLHAVLIKSTAFSISGY